MTTRTFVEEIINKGTQIFMEKKLGTGHGRVCYATLLIKLRDPHVLPDVLPYTLIRQSLYVLLSWLGEGALFALALIRFLIRTYTNT